MGYDKVLIVGSGGREHALCWAASATATTIFVAPGNGGTRGRMGAATVTPVNKSSNADIVAFCREQTPLLVVVGPEVPLCDGLAGESP